MQTATLITEVCDGKGPSVRRLAVACDHGVSEFSNLIDRIPPTLRLSEWDAEGMVVAHHFELERCRCTSALRARYALDAGTPAAAATM